MSEEVKEEKKEEKVNPFLTPVKIIEPEHKLPDYTFDMLPEEQKAVLAQHGWTDLMPVQRKTMPYMLAARDMLVQSKTGSSACRCKTKLKSSLPERVSARSLFSAA